MSAASEQQQQVWLSPRLKLTGTGRVGSDVQRQQEMFPRVASVQDMWIIGSHGGISLVFIFTLKQEKSPFWDIW